MAASGAAPKSPFDAYTRDPSRTALPKWMRIRLLDQRSSTETTPSRRVKRSARLPPLYAEDTNSRWSSPQTGIATFTPKSAGCAKRHSSAPVSRIEPRDVAKGEDHDLGPAVEIDQQRRGVAVVEILRLPRDTSGGGVERHDAARCCRRRW